MRDAETAGAGRRRATVAGAMELLPGPGGERFARVLEHGSMDVEVYAPRGSDPQEPHARDELYMVVEGTGEFVNGPDRHTFGPGDVASAAVSTHAQPAPMSPPSAARPPC